MNIKFVAGILKISTCIIMTHECSAVVLLFFPLSKSILCGPQSHISVSSPIHRSAGLRCHTVFVNLSSASLYWGNFPWYKWPYKVSVLAVKAYGEEEVQIYKSFSSSLEEVKWLASRYRRFPPGETAANVGSTGDCIGPRSSLKFLQKIEICSYKFQ